MNTNAFTNGTLTWRQLDHIIDCIARDIDDELDGMTDNEKRYVIDNLSDYISNLSFDLMPDELKMAPIPFADPTPMVCDHCGEPVHCDNREPINGEIGSFVHLSGYFGCAGDSNTAAVNGKQCLYKVGR